MPQPLSKVKPNANVLLNNVGIFRLREKPVLSSLALECISSWSTVESWMLDLYIDLAGGKKTMAADMFLALEGNSAKSSAINSLVSKLDPRLKELYAAISKMARSRAKARDKIAHWVWGFSPELPDCLLLADPREIATQDMVNFASIFVYSEADFLSIIAENEKIASWGQLFRMIVRGGQNSNDKLYDMLCSEPEIRDTLGRRAQDLR